MSVNLITSSNEINLVLGIVHERLSDLQLLTNVDYEYEYAKRCLRKTRKSIYHQAFIRFNKIYPARHSWSRRWFQTDWFECFKWRPRTSCLGCPEQNRTGQDRYHWTDLYKKRSTQSKKKSQDKISGTKFNNRVRTKHKGWLAPSVEHKIGTHLHCIQEVQKILPVTRIVVETASFDTQKLKNPEISGTEYQNGDQKGFWNVREYVLFRDNHECQHCHGKKKIQS